MGGPENGNFPLLYVMKMSLRRWVGGSKKPQNTLRNIKMAPKVSLCMFMAAKNVISAKKHFFKETAKFMCICKLYYDILKL